MLVTPTPRWLGYAWCVWSWRLMHDNLLVYWSVCDVTILCSSFHVDPTPRWLGYAWCVWSWRLMHDNLFVFWSVCDVTILCSSFHVDNSTAEMVGLCLMRISWKLMHDDLFVYWLVCDITILRSSSLVFDWWLSMRMIMKVDAWQSFRVLIGVWCNHLA